MHHRFFSIIVPAHNEELLIERTLRYLEKLDYPKDKYEIIVVENGSTDATYKKARQHEARNIKVYSTEKRGVSYARNLGLSKCSPRLEWAIFMDADVSLQKDFLEELDDYLETHPKVGYGTATVYLDSNTRISNLWSRINSFFYWVFKVLFTIHIVKKEYASKASYDEYLVSGEDIQYGRILARQHARFFLMRTNKVKTSDRRFKKKGYLTMFFINFYHGLINYILPRNVLKKIDWEVIR